MLHQHSNWFMSVVCFMLINLFPLFIITASCFAKLQIFSQNIAFKKEGSIYCVSKHEQSQYCTLNNNIFKIV